MISGDAVQQPIPSADLIYINAGVVAPPLTWLRALKPGGRMIFPWRPTQQAGFAVIVQRLEAGFAVDPFMPSYFIPCVGASDVPEGSKSPSYVQAQNTRSLHLKRDAAPNETATAIYEDLWFSSKPIEERTQEPRRL